MINQKFKNKNRGYRKLEVWKLAIELYFKTSKVVPTIEDKPYKIINQLLGSAFSIH
jgi:hypothetical protein